MRTGSWNAVLHWLKGNSVRRKRRKKGDESDRKEACFLSILYYISEMAKLQAERGENM